MQPHATPCNAVDSDVQDDPLTLEAMHNLACTLWHLNKFDKKAKEYFEKVVQKCKHAKQEQVCWLNVF